MEINEGRVIIPWPRDKPIDLDRIQADARNAARERGGTLDPLPISLDAAHELEHIDSERIQLIEFRMTR